MIRLADPVVVFVAAAAGVFLLSGALGGEPSDGDRLIEITTADIDRLKESFEAVWLRPASSSALGRARAVR